MKTAVVNYGGAKIHIKPLTPKDSLEITKKATNKKGEKDDELLIKNMGRTIIVDWEGMKDDAGNEVPYSSDNVESVILNEPDLFNFVMEKLDELKEKRASAREAEIKN